MANIFHFKQFSIDQTNCAMKVNTDGVLLAALCESTEKPISILDIGTGTGLIALMLAQKYTPSFIHAVEIDEQAAGSAKSNFINSPYHDRIEVFHSPIEDYWKNVKEKYDLIISNPPFFINSLASKNPNKELARHTDISFYERLVSQATKKLNDSGTIYLILPLSTTDLVKKICSSQGLLHVRQEIRIHSFPYSKPHRSILALSFENLVSNVKDFTIYETKGVYTEEYKNLLKDYLTIF